MLSANLRRLQHPYLIADIGMHHENDVGRLREYVHAAQECGCSAVKIQWYRKEDLCAPNAPAHWDPTSMQTQRDLLTDPIWEIGEAWALIQDELPGLDYIVTAFHPGPLPECDAVKISSGDSSYGPLLQHFSRQEAQLFIATGGHPTWDHLIHLAQMFGPERMVPMHCCSKYPCTPDQANVSDCLSKMDEILNRPVDEGYILGYSDHCVGLRAVEEACGHSKVRVIEKHFTLDAQRTDMDHLHAAGPEEMRAISRLQLAGTKRRSHAGVARECDDHDTGQHIIRRRVELDGKEHWWRL